MVSFNILDRIVHPRRKSQRHHKKSYSENDAAVPTVSTTTKPSSSSRCTCRGSQYCNQCDDMAEPTAGFGSETNPFDYAHSLYNSSASTSLSSSLSSSSSAAAASAADRMHYQTSMLNPTITTTNGRPRPKSTQFVDISGSRYNGEDSAAGVSLWAARRRSELPQGHMARYDAK